MNSVSTLLTTCVPKWSLTTKLNFLGLGWGLGSTLNVWTETSLLPTILDEVISILYL